MNPRVIGVLAMAVAAVVGLTGCTANIETATPTPVAFKACMVSGPDGFNDGEINQDAYYGLLQAEAQYGVSTSALQLKAGSSSYQTFRAARKLVSRGCNLVFTVAGVRGQLATLANGNPKVRFVELEPRASQSNSQQVPNGNLTDIAYDTRVAFLQAGYLAASKAASGKVAVIGSTDDSTVESEIWYFRQGVYQYAERAGKLVQILGAQQAEPATWKLLPSDVSANLLRSRTRQLIAAGADVLVPIGVNGLVVAQIAQASQKYVIGGGSDWSVSQRYSSVRDAVLASVPKPYSQAVVDQVAQSLGLQSASPAPSSSAAASGATGSSWFVSLTATLTPEGKISFGGVAQALEQLASDYLTGRSTVVEPSPAVQVN